MKHRRFDLFLSALPKLDTPLYLWQRTTTACPKREQLPPPDSTRPQMNIEFPEFLRVPADEYSPEALLQIDHLHKRQRKVAKEKPGERHPNSGMFRTLPRRRAKQHATSRSTARLMPAADMCFQASSKDCSWTHRRRWLCVMLLRMVAVCRG